MSGPAVIVPAMKPASILLRVLLSAALILNGIGSAVAGARMAGVAKEAPAAVASAHAHHAVAAPAQAPGACHDESGTTAHEGAPSPAADHGKHGVDCCQGMCACHCMQQAQVTFATAMLASTQVAQSAGVRAMSSAHETPRLPHLIRPPIFQAS